MTQFTTGCERCDNYIREKHALTVKMWELEDKTVLTSAQLDQLKGYRAAKRIADDLHDAHLSSAHIQPLPF